MVFTVETGAGTPGANAYATRAYVLDYLTDRNRQTENTWSTGSQAVQEAAIIAATDFIETRWGPLFRGVRALPLIVGREASGLLTIPSLPLNTETLTVGLKVYRFVNAIAQENDILIPATVDELLATIAGVLDASSSYLVTAAEEHTQPNYEAAGLVQSSTEISIYARAKGESGNSIAFSTTITGATVTAGGFLTDGLDEAEQPLSFPRRDLYNAAGYAISGVPIKVRQATAEYAVRAKAAVLAADPTFDARAMPVTQTSISVGPVSKSVTYAQAVQTIMRPYPAADRLLAEFCTAIGGVVRA